MEKSSIKVGVIDYGICNVKSVEKAFLKIGAKASVVTRSEDLKSFSHWVLPGVGAFPEGMSNLRQRGFDTVLRIGASCGVPLLGICLGMQLLAERGEEGGDTQGLGLIGGNVVKLSVSGGLRLPHMGWNECSVLRRGSVVDIGIENPIFYFLHSYHFVPREVGVIVASCQYGEEFVVSIEKENVIGCQFHPEKSQMTGLAVLERFLNIGGL